MFCCFTKYSSFISLLGDVRLEVADVLLDVVKTEFVMLYVDAVDHLVMFWFLGQLSVGQLMKFWSGRLAAHCRVFN